ncbi:hypothetical protein FRC09_004486 [Ceratobasidium sp. 395]|nr:hypothetical protein FRC09_004486 [Ceratobasidium sp. 395]
MPELDPSTSNSNFPSSLSLGPLRSNTQNSTTQMEMEEETEAAWKASRQPPPAPIPSSSMPLARNDPSPVYVNSQVFDSQDRRTEGTGVDITSVMTFEEIIPHLNRRGCRNLADEMDPTSYSKNSVNGGGLGDIYKGVLKNGVEVAIKTIRPVYSQDEEIQKHLKRAAREIYTWSKCRHQNVQPLLGLLEFRGQIGMVSVWEKHGNIKNYLKLNPVSVQVAEGLFYLHQLGVVHADLKADNILVSGDGTPMLGDFGCSSLREYTLQFTSTIAALGSPRWTAPEVLDGEKASPPADVYALGITILEMVTGKLPWSELTSTPAVITAVLVKGTRPARPLEVMPQGSQQGDDLWRLLQQCWVSEPSDRPSAMQVGVVMRDITRDGLLEVEV